MKVVILAAGKGTRMLPLTEHIPKVLVPVLGKPFLGYLLQHLKLAGFSEFVLVGGYKIEKLKEFVMQYGINAIIVEQREQQGTAHALLQAKMFCGKEQFVVVNGDSLFSPEDLKELVRMHFTSCIVGKETDHPEKYGVLAVQGNKLVRIVEKPKEYAGNIVNVGLYKFTPEIWTALDKITVSARGEYELTDGVTWLARHGNVEVLKLKDYWVDLGSREDIPRVEKFLREDHGILPLV